VARRLFFEADVVALEKAPDGRATACNPMLVHRADHLIQRQIRLLLGATPSLVTVPVL
jgi:hypothetical protein